MGIRLYLLRDYLLNACLEMGWCLLTGNDKFASILLYAYF